MSWEEIVEKKRKILAALVPEKWQIPASQLPPESQRSVISFPEMSGLLSAEELTITQLKLQELAQQIASGDYTAVQVCQAYCHRASIAHQLVNCLIEIFFDSALEQAKELDEYLRKNGRAVGPLHGVPVSLKDMFRIKGLESSIGYVSRLGKVDEEESVMTECLRKAGAVVYIKTSVPQTLMIGETISNILGRTLNPYNRLLSCGGSSGGEGALIALHGSLVGVGTDIGGSVRIPAAFNSLWGLKPSHGRLPLGNVARSLEGAETVNSVCGPMTHSAGDLAYFMRSVLQQKPWNYDSKVIEMPWQEARYVEGKTGKKVFGVVATNGIFGFDGVVMPHPPVLRGVQLVINALRMAGHIVVEWQPHKHGYAVELLGKIYNADGGATMRRELTLSGEPPVPSVKAGFESVSKELDLTSLWKIQADKYKYQQEYLAIWQQQSHVDGWIQPVAPHAAVKHDDFKYYGYTTIMNLLDWPAATIPVTFAEKEKDAKDLQYKGVNALDTKTHETYDADIYDGAPVAVQVVGRRLQEEYVIGLAEQIGAALSVYSLGD